MVNLAVELEKEGISAFRFDFAGNGWGAVMTNVIILYAIANYQRLVVPELSSLYFYCHTDPYFHIQVQTKFFKLFKLEYWTFCRSFFRMYKIQLNGR